ncbi:MAG: hypothetical protein M3463_08850 [Verrucomicrobiota bacterium]|nr:hypothetical protein [Verrucomicrobiota bacterium]
MQRLLWPLWIFLCLLLAGAARCHNWRDVFVDGRIYFVDADCYSRMTRARKVMERPGTVLRHHDFENYPGGTMPHTTAPMDYLLLGAKGILDLGFLVLDPRRTSVLAHQTLDLAGALIGPLLGMATCAFLAIWATALAGKLRRFAGAVPFFVAVSPILVHGTVLGRPDHQSLLIFCLAIALGAEALLARNPSRGWSIVSGAAWGLALWVSLYEPLVLWVSVTGAWLVFDRTGFLARERRAGFMVLAAVVTLGLLVEGWRIRLPTPELREFLANWSRSIGELQHLDPRASLLYGWLGWLIVATPVLLLLARRHDRRAWAWLALILILFGLTLWQIRWGYFLALVFVMALPWQLAALHRPWAAWPVFVIALWPLAGDWEERLFPNPGAQKQRALQRREGVLLREIAERMRSEDRRPFLAPWWISPALAYWSGQPGVAGSSHQSIAGIVDSARFYLAEDLPPAVAILRARGVYWIVADEPSRVIGNSAALLGAGPPATALASLLARRDVLQAPLGWTASGAFENQFYKLWKVDEPDAGAPSPAEAREKP